MTTEIVWKFNADKMDADKRNKVRDWLFRMEKEGLVERKEFVAVNNPKAEKPKKAKKGDPIKPTPLMQYMGKTLYNRRESTMWSYKESEAFKYLEDSYGDERAFKTDIKIVLRYYEHLKKGDPENDISRRDLLTCLNNWQGEVDRANNFKFPTAKQVAFKQDEPPPGWQAFWEKFTGKKPDKDWFDISDGVRAEILAEMAK